MSNLTLATKRRERFLSECNQRGIAVMPFGKGWRLTGPGVDLMCADLDNLDGRELCPDWKGLKANKR